MSGDGGRDTKEVGRSRRGVCAQKPVWFEETALWRTLTLPQEDSGGQCRFVCAGLCAQQDPLSNRLCGMLLGGPVHPSPQRRSGSWEFCHYILGISTPLDRRARGSVSQPKAPTLWCVLRSLGTHLHVAKRLAHPGPLSGDLYSRPVAIPS